MALSRNLRLQLRLVACHVGGVLAAIAAMPFLLANGLELRNVVVASALGLVAFLALAFIGGIVWRRVIIAQPVLSAITAPVAIFASIYLLLRVLSGFALDEARLAFEAAVVGGVAAMFSSGLFALGESLSPGGLAPPN